MDVRVGALSSSRFDMAETPSELVYAGLTACGSLYLMTLYEADFALCGDR